MTSFKLLLCYFTQTDLEKVLKSRALVQACCGTKSLLRQPCLVPGGCWVAPIAQHTKCLSACQIVDPMSPRLMKGKPWNMYPFLQQNFVIFAPSVPQLLLLCENSFFCCLCSLLVCVRNPCMFCGFMSAPSPYSLFWTKIGICLGYTNITSIPVVTSIHCLHLLQTPVSSWA